MILRKGQTVSITCDGRTVPAIVVLASPNGRSLILAFEAWIDGHVGTMPVLQDEDGTYRALITGTVIRIDAQH